MQDGTREQLRPRSGTARRRPPYKLQTAAVLARAACRSGARACKFLPRPRPCAHGPRRGAPGGR